jgi:large subunit ribosomal protein L9
MKVILQQDVKSQGKKGQLIEVSDGYARNFLFPRKLAAPATEENMAVLRQKAKTEKERIEREKAAAQADAKKLEACVVTVRARGGEGGKLFGSVTSKEICEALAEQSGIVLDKRNVEQADPIRSFGSFQIKCRFGYEITGTIHLMVVESK